VCCAAAHPEEIEAAFAAGDETLQEIERDRADYAVTPDGKRFLVKVAIGEEPEPRFHVVLNWPSLLE